MAEREIKDAEVKALAGECVGAMRLLSESATPLTKRQATNIINEPERKLAALKDLADRLP